MKKHSHFSRYRSSQDSPSSVENIDVSPRAGLWQNRGYSGSSNLPKPKLNNFDDDPREYAEWSSMFLATVNQPPTRDSEELSHLKTPLTGTLSSAKFWMGYSGQFYFAALSTRDSKFGRPLVVTDAHLESLCNNTQLKPDNSAVSISFSVNASNTVNMLKESQHFGDLQSSSTLYIAVDELIHVYVNYEDKDLSDLNMFEKWLSRIALTHEVFSCMHERAKRTRPQNEENWIGERWCSAPNN